MFLLAAGLLAVVVFQRARNENIRRELSELRAVTLDYWQHRTPETADRLLERLVPNED
jgi:hypothetical protein